MCACVCVCVCVCVYVCVYLPSCIYLNMAWATLAWFCLRIYICPVIPSIVYFSPLLFFQSISSIYTSLDSFKYLGSVVHNNGESRQEVLRQIGLDSLSMSIWRYWYLCRRTKIQILISLVILVLLYCCETWTLNTDLKRQIDVIGSKCLHSWSDCVKSATALGEWIKAYYQHSPPTWTPAI